MLAEFLMSVMISFIASVISQVYVFVLTQPEHLLFGWKKWLNKTINKKGHNKIYKMLTCELCFAGQIALWTYVFFYFVFFGVELNAEAILFHIGMLIFTISLSIFMTKLTVKTGLWKD